MEAINIRVSHLDESLKKVRLHDRKISDLEESVKKISILIQSQQEELIDLADRGRRNNLIVFGMHEGFQETDSDVKESVLTDLFENHMGVKVSTIERFHRLGKKSKSAYCFRELLSSSRREASNCAS